MSQDEAKARAAQAALELLPEAGVIGLGSGSTAKLFIDGLAGLVKSGRQLVGVPTSEASRQQAQALGIPLLSDDGPWEIAVTVDGADEVSESLDLIKGGGGCHAREKIVGYSSTKYVVVVDESKLSTRLGEKWAVPVEVLTFGHAATARALAAHGTPTLRLRGDRPWLTDSNNLIYDVAVEPVADPGQLDRDLRQIPGVVETGLFVGRADVVLVAGAEGIRRLNRA